jgi:hypothetical protein
LHYNANWYVDWVRDANNYTTNYVHGPPPSAYPGPRGIGEILTITYPGGAHIDYTYQPEPGAIGGHYLQTASNELGYVTTYHRNGTTHRIYQIDYPDGGYETFTYNEFGQV